MENEIDSENDDLEVVGNMLNAARKYGLEAEVVWSFANELTTGTCTYAEAANSALHEWDI